MTRPSLISLLFAGLSLACATSPAATPAGSAPAATQDTPAKLAVTAIPALNPVGIFDFTATAPDGSAAKGSIIITGYPGAYAGKVEREGLGWTDLTSIAVEGQTMTTTASIPEGVVVTTVTFTGDEFTGKWTLQGFEGAVSGRRR